MDSKDIKCSIIIPVYNGEKFIDKTIQSCLSQTVKCEIIVINDASKDGSDMLILPYVEKGVIYIKNDKNLGLMKSNNKAVGYSHSNYLLFLGHDDMLRADHVELMLKEFNNDTAFVHCNSDLINENDTIFGLAVINKKQLHRTKYIKKYLFITNVIHSTGTIINKKYFDQVGRWNEDFRNYGEWLLWIKLANVGKTNYCTKAKAMYRRHETNITNSFKNSDIKKELKKYFRSCRIRAIKNILKIGN